jgi:hypothetical protein
LWIVVVGQPPWRGIVTLVMFQLGDVAGTSSAAISFGY